MIHLSDASCNSNTIVYIRTAPPKIQINPQLQTVRPGDTAIIDCVAHDSSHSVTVSWSRIGADVPTGVSIEVNNDKLVIRGAQETDSGRYLCTAVNAAGKAEAVGELIVNSKIEPIDNVKEELTIIGSNIDLKCPSDLIEDQDISITWKFENSEQLPANVKVINKELRIKNLRLENSGRYTCVVSFYNSEIDHNHVVVKVKGNDNCVLLLVN